MPMLLQITRWIGESKGSSAAYTALIFFLAGIASAELFAVPFYVPLFLVSLGVVCSLGAAVFTKKRQLLFLGCMCAAAFSLGMVRVGLLPDLQEPFVPFHERAVVAVVEIAEDPQVRTSSVQVKAHTQTVDGSEIQGTLLLQLPVGSAVSYGDLVNVRGKIKLPEVFLTDNGREFDYPRYVQAKGEGAIMQAQYFQIVQPHSFSIQGSLYNLKHAFMRLVDRTIPEPEGSFLEGMLLGNRDALSNTLRDAFIAAGLVHIVVLSGYNLTLVADVFMRISSVLLPRLAAVSASATSVILFACMAGLDATVLRASIMALIVLFAKALRRPSVIMRSLSLACFLMVLYNPLVLLYDPSFVLSFLATFGLVTLSGPVASLLSGVSEKFGLRDIAAATLATQVFVLPVLIFYTGKFSLVALPANLIALPLVPYAMYGGFIASLMGLLGSIVSLPFAYAAWILLGSIIFIATTAAKIPFAIIDVSQFQTPALLLLYIVLVPSALILWQHNEHLQKEKHSI